MLRLHREGRATITLAITISAIILIVFMLLKPELLWLGIIISLLLLITVLQFFRNPKRLLNLESTRHIMAPADGKIVSIEKVMDSEGIPGEWLQVSIFMSPINVHVNRHPCSGIIRYYAYHAGKYLVAWHPKSSTENERTTIVYETPHGFIKLRQIAGAMARRIVCYVKEGEKVKAGEDLGFIKFGSRVDLLLPLNVKINVSIDDIVKGNITRIGEFVS